MSARRAVWRGRTGLVALVVGTVLAGCAGTVAGHGSLAAGARATSAQRPTAGRTGGEAANGTPPATSAGAGVGLDGSDTSGSRVCSLFTAPELTTLFGEPVTTAAAGSDQSCDFETADNGGVLVQVYDLIDLAGEIRRSPGGKNTTVRGLPAYQGDREVLVARSTNPAHDGVIVARNLFFGDAQNGTAVTMRLLDRIVPAFAD